MRKEPESDPNAFHYLTIDWTPDRIVFDINGEKVRTLEGEDVTKLNEPKHLVMGLFSGLKGDDLKDPENTRESYSDFGKVEVYHYDS